VDPVEAPLIELTQGPVSLSKKKRRTTADIMAAITADMRTRLKPILPQISAALHNDLNESSSRLILDRILQHVLGYSIEEIKAEQRIQGRTADYVLISEGVDTIVIEAKRIGSVLKEKQIFQATSYAAYSGIKWALLTNVAVWQLYKVSTTDKIEPHLVFTIDLRKGLTEDAAYFFALISRCGMMRKTPLERLWLTRRALSPESLISAILHEDVLNRIRNVIARDNGISLDLADIKAAVERDILKL
ncbi:MAG: stress protein, partial [Verrucomicrobiaceae bacterium]